MPQAMAATDAIVSRAGATSLAEISARRIPAILVPYPYATADHQTTNAEAWVELGAALMIPDAEVEGERFRRAVLQLVDDPALRQQMRDTAGAADSLLAADCLADTVCSLSAS